MATVINTTQSNFSSITVNAVPAAVGDLIWTSTGTGLTLAGAPGTIFPTMQADQVTPAFWYHGGNPVVPVGTIKVLSCNSITAVNSSPIVVSSQFQKGIFELRQTTPNTITGISQAVNAQITTSASHNFNVGDFVEITGTLAVVTPGIYKVTAVVNVTNFQINFNSTATPNTLTAATVTLHNYFWDEVYTTPLGLYNARDTSVVHPSYFEFRVTNNNSDELVIFVGDTNIIPKVGDFITVQKFFQNENSFTNQSTTDGLNDVLNYSESETYEFQIVAVSSINNPLTLIIPYTEYTLTLDKSFAPIITTPLEKYIFALLNRNGTTPDRELFTDTWKLTQVYRSQLLGDPYNFIGSTQPAGRKNFLYYNGAELLGVRNLLQGVMPEANTPFVVLDFADEIKDRIYNNTGEFEVHLPTVMIDQEASPCILTNSNPFTLANPVLTDVNGAGDYAALYMKYPGITPAVRYGFVMYDLRIVIIDHAELATAMGYNANRNYTLPQPVLPTHGNTLARPTLTNPILITNVQPASGGPLIVTSIANHTFVTGDQVIISGVLGNISANNTATHPTFYVNVLDPLNFQLFYDFGLSVPVMGIGAYSGGGSFYGQRLAYEYFYTYRIDGAHYTSLPFAEVVPFNWQQGQLLSDSTTALLDTLFPSMTHLVDINKTEGFLADNYEIIIGKYTQSLIDPFLIAGVEDVVVMAAKSLKDITLPPNLPGVQNTNHTATFSRSIYDSTVTAANLLANNAPSNPKYDILNVDSQKIYNLLSSPLPSTLFTSDGIWTRGLLLYKAEQQQYRLTFTVNVPAANWNGTQNPTFVAGDPLMSDKLITEMEFLIKDANGNPIDTPYIYAKISPPIKKNNTNDLTLQIELDF
jgi:hypothetical protein